MTKLIGGSWFVNLLQCALLLDGHIVGLRFINYTFDTMHYHYYTHYTIYYAIFKTSERFVRVKLSQLVMSTTQR